MHLQGILLRLPAAEALGMLQSTVAAAAAAACGPTTTCPSGCRHPWHASGAALLRCLHHFLNNQADQQRDELSSKQYAQLVGTLMEAEAAAVAAAHNLLDGILLGSSSRAATQSNDSGSREGSAGAPEGAVSGLPSSDGEWRHLVDVLFALRHICECGAGRQHSKKQSPPHLLAQHTAARLYFGCCCAA